MIFYFSGSGNSLDVARRMKKENEELFNIAECLKNNLHDFKLKDGENLAFIFPVYFYNVPTIIKDFIEASRFENVSYLYSIITCGGSIANSLSILNKILNKKDLVLNYGSSLLMPDNSMLFYQIDNQLKNNELLKKSYLKLEEIKKDIDNKKTIKFKGELISKIVGSMYPLSTKTKKFYVMNDRCIKCGLCVNNCPINAIEFIENSPKWTKDRCVKCSACINRCPTSAIQYGLLTKKRNRYINPNI